jgi:hypothetical protein
VIPKPRNQTAIQTTRRSFSLITLAGTLVALLFFCFISVSLAPTGFNRAFAQDDQKKPITTMSLAHLFETLSQQPPLMEVDLTFYRDRFSELLLLNDDPSALGKLLETTGWKEERLIYVATKVGLGLMMILDPENPRLKDAPDFAKPSASELDMISEHLPAITKAIEAVSSSK